jgi:hypothetical protein
MGLLLVKAKPNRKQAMDYFLHKVMLWDAEGAPQVVVSIPVDGLGDIMILMVAVGKVRFDDWLAGSIEE